MTSSWSIANIPNQDGKFILITGANSGLGFESAGVLAAKKAHVIMACRSLERAQAARHEIVQAHPSSVVDVLPLDLTSLDSVRRCAMEFNLRYPRLDVLLNNAGVMATPRLRSEDGFELQFGANHLGHFALSGLLLERLLAAPSSRVVTVYSVADIYAWIDFNSFGGQGFYNRWIAYGQAKLANLVFAMELNRRLAAREAGAISLAAHPGLTRTNLQVAGLSMQPKDRLQARLMRTIRDVFFQDVTLGALPQLLAATAPEARGGEVYGPQGFLQMAGPPKKITPFNRGWRDEKLGKRLWKASQELTGVKYLNGP